jgi:hypothetical protein
MCDVDNEAAKLFSMSSISTSETAGVNVGSDAYTDDKNQVDFVLVSML